MNNRNVKVAVRIVCLILALMMVLGIVLAILPPASDAYGEMYDADMTVAIGLAYGAKAPTTYAVSAPEGFELGFDLKGEFYPLIESFEPMLTVLSDDVVPYRIHVPIDESAVDFQVQYAELAEIAQELSLHYFRAFVKNGMEMRMGAFSTRDSAQKTCDALYENYGVYAFVTAPSKYEICVRNSAGQVIFAFDCGTSLSFSLRPIQPESGSYYISAPDGYAYEGI